MKRSRRRLSAASRRRPRRSHCHRLIRRKWSCARGFGCREGPARDASHPRTAARLAYRRVRNRDPCGPPSRKWFERKKAVDISKLVSRDSRCGFAALFVTSVYQEGLKALVTSPEGASFSAEPDLCVVGQKVAQDE